MTKLPLPYVREYRDRHGKMRRYFRRNGKNLGKLPLGSPLSAEFTAAYQAFLNNKPAPAPIVTKEMHGDSLAKLITDFYDHPWYKQKAPNTRDTYRRVLEPIMQQHGHKSVTLLTAVHAEKIIAKIGDERPSMANLTRAVMRRVMRLAIKQERYTGNNPFAGIETFKTGAHHTWTDGELRLYEQRWRLGSRERLAYALLLYAGQRVGDTAKMRRSDVSDGLIHVVQQKTGSEVWVEIHPELDRAMKACPTKGLALIGDDAGRPLSRGALSALMARAIDEAGLPARCVAHGLRKAHLRLIAEGGGTVKELQSTGGHKTLREVERYTEAADRKRLSRSAIAKLRIGGDD